eukprot:2897250-Pleurochrysis_carterae.AAC.2
MSRSSSATCTAAEASKRDASEVESPRSLVRSGSAPSRVRTSPHTRPTKHTRSATKPPSSKP